jgi:phenylacetate-coenzyme A ligase PaaK-like adenylate-forming protein
MHLIDRIFSIHSDESFEKTALEVFRFQYENNSIYRSFVNSLGKVNPTSITDIPFLPIGFFKTHSVISCNPENIELTFLSSGTTDSTRSKHLIHSASIYEKSFEASYRKFIGKPEKQVILGLLPNYIEQGNSSLVYMVDKLIHLSQSNLSGFMLNDLESVKSIYTEATSSGKKVVIFGVSYALLDLAEKGTDLSQALIIETGGMKGRRAELTKEELHQELMNGLNVPFVSSEYGMTELLSQAYSNKEGLFTEPNWMKILIRDTNDPFCYVSAGKSGGINVIDLANIYSCSFIATQDLGKIIEDKFQLLGRFDNADIRGCNLMVE